MSNDEGGAGGGEMGASNVEDEFGFPILDPTTTIQMKNIPPSTLPNFHGMVTEDPETFLFEFDVLCHSYDYSNDAQKLKLFPTTLKDATLCWFMGLGGNTIKTWDEMRKNFLSKYQDYCTNRDLHEEMFKMAQKEDEILEDYVERFHYNVKRAKQNHLELETLKIIFLCGIRDECIDLLNLMGKGDVSQLTYPKICDLCKHFSRGKPNLVRDLETSFLESINQQPRGK
jgi:hypothetical protein